MSTVSTHAPALPPATGIGLFLRQTAALFLDGLRRLRSAKLFWIALLLSVLVAAACGYVGINATGLSFPGFGNWDNPVWNTTVFPASEFYKLIFVSFGVALWLSYGANLLALISTANLVPSLVEEGNTDLYVTRPVGRVQLLLTRYLVGLMFVALQTLCFSAVAMAVFAIRGGVFLPGLLWAVPYVTFFFSLIYCVSALVGLLAGGGLTSTLLSILVTLLFWMCVWGLDWAETFSLAIKDQLEARVEYLEGQVERNQRLVEMTANAGEISRNSAEAGLMSARNQLEESRSPAETARRVHQALMWVKAPFPKTGEINAALQARLTNEADEARRLEAEREEEARRLEERADRNEMEAEDREALLARQSAQRQGAEESATAYASRSAWWTFGTSAAFEAVILLICCWNFARRDLS